LRTQALSASGRLQQLGVKPGDRVAALLTNNPAMCVGALGVWLSGGVLVSVPLRARGQEPADWLQALSRLLQTADTTLLLLDVPMTRILSDAGLGVPVVCAETLLDGRPGRPEPASGDAPMLVQCTAGTTGAPRGVELSADAVMYQLDEINAVVAMEPDRDHVLSWLPISHDMGLVAMLQTLGGVTVTLGTPERFLANPGSWFADCAELGATATVGPSFALAMAARAAQRRPPAPNQLRVCTVGAERIYAEALRRVCEVLGPDRLSWQSLLPAYGLAEVGLAATLTAPGTGPQILPVDSEQLGVGRLVPAPDGAEGAVELVGCGHPLRDTEVLIKPTEGHIGEIRVRSPSARRGYLGGPPLGPTRSDREVNTGDFGAILAGELYVTGRGDDLLQVGGHNVHAADVEQRLAAVNGARLGGHVLVRADPHRTREIALVLESRASPGDAEALGRALAREAGRCGVPVNQLLVLRHGQLPKTPSGKLRRFHAAALVQDPPPEAWRVRL
jgi:fatty-acyl-CoA synthase